MRGPVGGPGGPGRHGRMMAGGKRSKNPRKTLARLLRYIRDGYTVQFTAVLICILFSAVANVAGSMFLRVLIDDYIAPLLLQASPVFTGLVHALLLMAMIYLVGIVSTFLYNFIMVSISQGILKKVRDQMFEGMQKLPIRYFDTHTHGDLMSHFTNDTDTLQQMLSQSIPQMFNSLVTIVAVFLAMLFTNIWLTLFVLLGVAVMLVVTRRIGGKSARYFLEQQTSLGKVNGFIEEMIGGQKVVKVFCHEEKCKEQFDVLNDTLREHAKNANTFANILMPIMMNIGNLLYVLVAVVGGTLALSGAVGSSITIGVIASFLQLTKSFTMPINQISQQINMIVMALAGAERIFELMDEQPEQDNGYVTLVNAKYDKDGNLTETPEKTNIWAWKHPHEDGTITYQKVCGDVRFYDVDFGYNPDKIVLHDITLYAEPGQKVAFVGATGAGKTTITNLINRFYDIADGKIRYDGININKVKKSDLRRSLGIVLQDTNLFTGTIRDNIRYGNLDATDQEVEAAAQLANADDFIRRLPDGYDTVIDGDGGSLSQGQRQLLSIARAAVADPPVMILDEATSSIDTRTESIVQAGMDGLMSGRTVFVIAHRLSTVQNADVIMVLELGHIIERGNHEQLIAEKGKYYQLYTGAFELE
ncbi:MAG TPA: ABC transporter ATP-binding protein/permease [Candidatus Agathobaculum intestinipullorum]|nr:ABC transporter ATP-binding protein/permease [Candidatus Agathobaculum intestinipullorum]